MYRYMAVENTSGTNLVPEKLRMQSDLKEHTTALQNHGVEKRATHSIGYCQETGQEKFVQDDCIRYEAPSSATTLI